MPVSHDLDRAEIEQRYLELSKLTHPDRFVGGSSSERRAAMERSTAVNVAYRTLRDPVSRVEYLVKLGGIDLDSSDPDGGAPKPDQAFLMDMIERREKVDEARQQGPDAVDDMRIAVEDELDEVFEQAVSKIEDEDIVGAAHCLVTHRYLRRLLGELEETMELANL